jgi:hypothetical protein
VWQRGRQNLASNAEAEIEYEFELFELEDEYDCRNE